MCAGADHEVTFGRSDLGDLGEEPCLAHARFAEHVNPMRPLRGRMTMLADQAELMLAPDEEPLRPQRWIK